MQLFSSSEECVIQSDNSIHLVNLTADICICCQYQVNSISCDYVMICIFAQDLTLKPFLSQVLFIKT